jgi:voltage-gated potassium channel
LSGHTIVCGDSGSTWFVAEELLRTDRSVVLVVPVEEDLDLVRQLFGDVPALVGDPSDDDVLIAAGIERADGIIASMDVDKDNVLVVFTARRLAPKVRIIASLENPSVEAKLRVAGADAVVSPSRIGGLRIASELVRPKVVTFLDKMLRDESAGLRVEEIDVPEDGAFIGKTLAEVDVHTVAGAVLLAVSREGDEHFAFDPDPSTRVEQGMTLIVMVDAKGRERLQRAANP